MGKYEKEALRQAVAKYAKRKGISKDAAEVIIKNTEWWQVVSGEFVKELGFEKGRAVRFTMRQGSKAIENKGLGDLVAFFGECLRTKLRKDKVFKYKWKAFIEEGVLRDA